MTDIPVKQAQRQNPYCEFVRIVAAGSREPIQYDHRYFRLMSQSGGTFKVRFDNSGQETTVIGSGIGIKHVDACSVVEIINTHATDSMTVTVAMSMGEISDSRLSLSGTITVNQVMASTIITAADVVCATNAIQLLLALDTTRRAAHISNILANGQVCRLGDINTTATRGAELGIGETRIITNTAAIYSWFVGATKSIGLTVEQA